MISSPKAGPIGAVKPESEPPENTAKTWVWPRGQRVESATTSPNMGQVGLALAGFIARSPQAYPTCPIIGHGMHQVPPSIVLTRRPDKTGVVSVNLLSPPPPFHAHALFVVKSQSFFKMGDVRGNLRPALQCNCTSTGAHICLGLSVGVPRPVVVLHRLAFPVSHYSHIVIHTGKLRHICSTPHPSKGQPPARQQ